MVQEKRFDHAVSRGKILFSKDVNNGDIIRLNIL